MFSLKLARLALVAGAPLIAAAAIAADTGTLAVSATVTGTCKLISVPGMSFPALDPSTASPAGSTSSPAVEVTYRCTKGTAPSSFTVGGSDTGTYTANTAGTALAGTGGNTDTIPFTITWTPPTAAGSGLGTGITPVTVPLTGSISNADFLNVTADTYTRNVTVAVNP